MRSANDADFNSNSRYLSVKLELYFNGRTEDPFTVTKEDYLIDADWLEEGSADSANPFGAVSANELTFRLYNENGMFNPTNNLGPYYGKIKSGLLIMPYIKPVYSPDEVEWEKLGEYFVTGWDAEITGTYADVTADDKWQQIFSSPSPNYPVERNIVFNTALEHIYSAMGFEVIVNPLLSKMLIYSFIEGTPLNFTQELLTGALAFCSCNKAGQPIIEPFVQDRITRAILTDDNQIKSVSATQSIIKTYDGVELTYSIPQGMDQEKLIDLQGLAAPSTTFQLQNVAFNKGPLWQLTSIGIKSLRDVRLLDYTATPWLATFFLNNLGEAGFYDIVAYGQTIGFTNIVLTDDVVKLLKVSSRYIQSEAYAQQYKLILSAFASSAIPTLSLSVKGNPLLNIGDQIVVQSDRYHLNFTGIIQRMQYKYTGGLSCDMLLFNADILQGVL